VSVCSCSNRSCKRVVNSMCASMLQVTFWSRFAISFPGCAPFYTPSPPRLAIRTRFRLLGVTASVRTNTQFIQWPFDDAGEVEGHVTIGGKTAAVDWTKDGQPTARRQACPHENSAQRSKPSTLDDYASESRISGKDSGLYYDYESIIEAAELPDCNICIATCDAPAPLLTA